MDRSKHTSEGLPNKLFLERRTISAVGEVYAIAEALLVHLKADPLFRITISSVIQSYLFAAKPIGRGVKGDAADLVCRAGAGLPLLQRIHALAETVLTLRGLGQDGIRRRGERWPRICRKYLAMDEGLRRMEEAFRSVVAVPTRTLGRPKVLGRVPRAERKES